jgi:MFS family permease
MTTDTRPTSSGIWRRDMLILYGATFLAYANISVFFQFVAYLGNIGIDPGWFGPIIGVFSAVSLLTRPMVIPFIHGGNVRRWLGIGTVAASASLFAYSIPCGLWGMMAIRIFHGLAFVVLGAALMTIIVAHIPRENSAQAFGILAIFVLIPNTLIPPLLPFLNHIMGGFTHVLALFAVITALVYPVVLMIHPENTAFHTPTAQNRPHFREILQNLKNLSICSLLAAMLLLYCGLALIFFFLDGYGRSIGIHDTGFFLTLTSIGEIGVRLAAGSIFDRMNKIRLSFWTLAGLAAGYALLAGASSETVFFALGIVLGLGWGIAMPVFSSLMLDISAPEFGAFNTTLGQHVYQGGFFIGPFLGAWTVQRWGFPPLFYLCAVMAAVAAVAVRITGKASGRPERKSDS